MAGVTRDRTNLYITFRQSFSHRPSKKRRFAPPASNGFAAQGGASEETQGLMSSRYSDDGDAVIEMDLLPPRWLDIQDEVNELLTTIAHKSSSLDQLHHKHVLPGFDDEEVKAQEERQIERLTQDITRNFHDCQSAIQRIEMMVRDARRTGGPGVGKGEETMARNIQISLAARVQETSASFRKKQSNYLKKLRTLGGLTLPAHSSPALPSSAFSADPTLLDTETDAAISSQTLQQTRLHAPRLQTNEPAIAQREREINDIATGIIELADIFKDLQTMVIDQGTMLDRIDYNVEEMKREVKEAEKELVVATGYQKKYTKRKIIFLLILIVVGMFVLLGIKLSRRGGGGGGGDGGKGAENSNSQIGEVDGQAGGSGGAERLAQTEPMPQGVDPLNIADPNGRPARWRRSRRRGVRLKVI